eukprot:TRINITY_DN357_c0_g2_i5.p1 TRINITY_DN357_c0_g2~~TRINITY_DN357_c0_g2_i5.p1  ORF type:complete len:673 (+),score=111.64 TRINITY_DN357_c0_g2_i5:101-2119(+)
MARISFSVGSLTWLFFNTAGVLSYLASLDGATTDIEIQQKAPQLTIFLLTSVSCFLFALLLPFLNSSRSPLCRRSKIVLPSITLLTIFILMAMFDGNTIENHGSYNRAVFVIVFFPLLFTCGAIYLSMQLASLSTILLTVISVLGTTLLLRFGSIQSGWPLGLHELSLSNLEDISCRIHTPLLNWHDLIPYRGQTFWTGSTECPKQKRFARLVHPTSKTQPNHLVVDWCDQPNIKITVPPNVKDFDFEKPSKDEFQGIVLDNSVEYNVPTEEAKKGVEISAEAQSIVVDCGVHRNVLVQVVRDDKIVKRVQQYFEKTPAHATKPIKPPFSPVFPASLNKEDRLNVELIYIDALSRAHFSRRFPKTVELLNTASTPRANRKIPKNTQYNKLDNTTLYQFFRYHAHEVTTGGNTLAMYTGYKVTTRRPTIWDKYQEHGYVTSWATNLCENWDWAYQPAKATRESRFDHHLVAPFCLPEAHPMPEPYGIWNGPYSIRRRCLAGRETGEYVFEYTNEFKKAYSDLPQFSISSFIDAHEGTGDVVKLLDDDLHSYLLNHPNLNNTIIFLVSDHGLHMGLWWLLQWRSVVLEHRLPLWMMLIPNWFTEKYPNIKESLVHNEQALVTSADMHHTLENLVEWPRKPPPVYESSFSVLSQKVPYERTCEDAEIYEYMCICK